MFYRANELCADKAIATLLLLFEDPFRPDLATFRRGRSSGYAGRGPSISGTSGIRETVIRASGVEGTRKFGEKGLETFSIKIMYILNY